MTLLSSLKCCPKCRVYKDLGEYHRLYEGHQTYCKTCKSELDRARYARNRVTAPSRRLAGVHPLACIGGPPEDRRYLGNGRSYLPPVIGSNVTINHLATVDSGCDDAATTTIGNDTLIMAHAHVGHNVQVSENCQIATGAILGGYCEIGKGAHIGLGAIVLPHRKVGANSEVGAGSVVTRDIPPDEVWAGNPAKKLPGKNPIPYSKRR